MRRPRAFWVVVHRWAGLTIASFMVIVGITGAIIPWQMEIQRILAPERFVVPPAPGASPLSMPALRHVAEARSAGVVDYLPLSRVSDEAATFSVASRPGAPALGFDEIVLDPYDGREIARARGGNLADGAAQIVPFLYSLHMTLLLGDWGAWLLGVAALIWTIDCFVGFYLTLPVARTEWWRHWGKSWRMRWRALGYRFTFDLHRAGSLWVWLMLLVFAWSSVGMNLRSIYEPVMAALVGVQADTVVPPPRAGSQRRLGMDQALSAARAVAAREVARRGLHIERERVLSFDAASNSYYLAVRTERDRSDEGANSYFTIDADDGHLISVALPTGEHAGNTIDYWIGQLHVAGVFGLTYRILVSLFGVFLAAISVTGVMIWLRKRAADAASMKARSQRRFSNSNLSEAH